MNRKISANIYKQLDQFRLHAIEKRCCCRSDVAMVVAVIVLLAVGVAVDVAVVVAVVLLVAVVVAVVYATTAVRNLHQHPSSIFLLKHFLA